MSRKRTIYKDSSDSDEEESLPDDRRRTHAMLNMTVHYDESDFKRHQPMQTIKRQTPIRKRNHTELSLSSNNEDYDMDNLFRSMSSMKLVKPTVDKISFYTACFDGDSDSVKHMMPHAKKQDICDGLKTACERKHVGVVRELLKYADLENGTRYLECACHGGDPAIFTLLVDRFRIQVLNLNFIFIVACISGQVQMIECVIKASNEREYYHGREKINLIMGLKCACEKNRVEAVKYLQDYMRA